MGQLRLLEPLFLNPPPGLNIQHLLLLLLLLLLLHLQISGRPFTVAITTGYPERLIISNKSRCDRGTVGHIGRETGLRSRFSKESVLPL